MAGWCRGCELRLGRGGRWGLRMMLCRWGRWGLVGAVRGVGVGVGGVVLRGVGFDGSG